MASHSGVGRHGGMRANSAAERAFLEEHGYVRVPQLVQWFATLRCGLGCAHCLAAGRGGGDMPLETAMGLVDQVAEMGVEEFLITGGEPLLREDLGTVIERLAARGVAYSINTAVMPSEKLQGVMRAHRPKFAAVSLDGPPEVHDAFRGRVGAFAEAMGALRFFGSLPGCHVAAGTTVTTANYGALGQTFHIVAESAADHWGIHLLIPEGRAEKRPDLFLSRGQLKDLLGFVARKRRYFPVQLADEIGYCGDMEPLLRDNPFRCGAGRAQCVVLPTGHVVPCTTLDLSTSAGSIHERPLEEIWRDGFAELRQWQPKERCAACNFAPACGGGCWLQRRHGMECAKDVWMTPNLVRSTAGLAVCLGLLGAAPAAGQTTLPDTPQETPAPASSVPAPGIGQVVPGRAVRPPAANTAAVAPGIEELIVRWYGQQVEPDTPAASRFGPGRFGGLGAGAGEVNQPAAPATQPNAELAKDPAYQFFNRMKSGELPKELPALAQQITAALDTKQRSLAFAAVVWRSVEEWCLANPPEKRTAEQDKQFRQTLAEIERAAVAWQREVVTARLDPYLNRNRQMASFGFMGSKAGPPPPPAWLILARHLDAERWGGPFVRKVAEAPLDPANKEAVDAFLKLHPWAEALELHVIAEGAATRVAAGDEAAIQGQSSLGVCDLLKTGDAPVTIRLFAGPFAAAAKAGHVQPTTGHKVTLAAGRQYGHADLLMAAYAQDSAQLDALVERSAPADPVAFGAVQKRLKDLEARLRPGVFEAETFPVPAAKPGLSVQEMEGLRRNLAIWMAEFWMF